MKKRYLVIVVLIIIMIGGISFFVLNKDIFSGTKSKIKIFKKEEIPHYKSIITNKTSKSYKLVDNKFIEDNILYKDLVLDVSKIKDNYYYSSKLDSYIYYKNVDEYKDNINSDERYKNYILFNKSIKTKSKFHLYDKNNLNKKLILINRSMDFPIIEYGDSGYFVLYLDNLYYINNDDVESEFDNNNTDKKSCDSVITTVYHFFYEDGDTSCNELICNSIKSVREQFDYLKNNNFFTINTTELRLFIEGKIRLPEHSILITIDDGSRAEKIIPVLEEYKINATLFLITAWYSPDNFRSPYLEIASHGNDLHNPGKCPGGQGGPIKCMEHDLLQKDLKTSRDILGGTTAFCFPFYEYNDYAINNLKEAGFLMAFVGGNRRVTRNSNLYLIPRWTLKDTTTIDEYISIVN